MSCSRFVVTEELDPQQCPAEIPAGCRVVGSSVYCPINTAGASATQNVLWVPQQAPAPVLDAAGIAMPAPAAALQPRMGGCGYGGMY